MHFLKFKIRGRVNVLCGALAVVLLGSLGYSAAAKATQVESDKKGKVSGTIVSRNGDVVTVKNKKSGSLTAVLMTDNTKIERKKGGAEFFRHSDMDVTAMANMDAAAILLVNKRVSDLDDYKVVAEAGIYFPSDGSALDAPAKADLDTLAAFFAGLQGSYLIEIAGYASSTGTKQQNQKLSEARAAAVAQYLRERDNVPMRRIVVPAGYGATHPAASNSDPQGRALNRRVDVKVIVNKGLAE